MRHMKHKPTVAIISETHGAGHGSETVLQELLRCGAPLDLSLVVVAPGKADVLRTAVETGHGALPLTSARGAIIHNLPAIHKVVPQLRHCALVHAWSARSFELALWLRKRLRIPVTGTLHDHPQAAFHGTIRRRLMRFSADRFNTLVCVSDAVRDACHEAKYRCPVLTIRNGLNESRGRRAPSTATRIGFLGMYAPQKGFDTVVRWIRRCSRTDLRWQFYGEPSPELQNSTEAIEREFAGHVVFKGHRTTPDIFAEIDVLIHASTYFDSLPTVLIEAARAGIPVVASCRGGAPEIVLEGETGLLYDPDNEQHGYQCFLRLAENASLRSRMGNSARRHYEEHFKADHMARGYQQLWHSVIQDANPLCRNGIMKGRLMVVRTTDEKIS